MATDGSFEMNSYAAVVSVKKMSQSNPLRKTLTTIGFTFIVPVGVEVPLALVHPEQAVGDVLFLEAPAGPLVRRTARVDVRFCPQENLKQARARNEQKGKRERDSAERKIACERGESEFEFDFWRCKRCGAVTVGTSLAEI